MILVDKQDVLDQNQIHIRYKHDYTFLADCNKVWLVALSNGFFRESRRLSTHAYEDRPEK